MGRRVIKPAGAPKISEVEVVEIAADELLQLGRREGSEPMRVDERPEASCEGHELLPDLRAHAQVRHQVHVRDAVLVRERDRASSGQQLVRHRLAENLFAPSECKAQVAHIALVVL